LRWQQSAPTQNFIHAAMAAALASALLLNISSEAGDTLRPSMRNSDDVRR
jgi:hypothetical protein